MPEGLPSLPEAIESAGAGYANAFTGMSEAALTGALSQTESLLAFANQVTQANYARYPQASGYAMASAREATSRLNSNMSGQFYGNLDAVMPGWRDMTVNPSMTASSRVGELTELTAKYLSPQVFEDAARNGEQARAYLVSSLTGRVPDDMMEQASILSAEQANRNGVFGQAASNIVTRDAARMSLERMTAGAGMAQQVLNMGATSYADMLTQYGEAFNVYQGASSVAGLYKAPLIDSSRVYTANLANITGTALTSPGAAMSALSQAQGANLASAASAWGTLADYNNSSWVSGLEMSQEKRNQQAMATSMKKQQRSQERMGVVGGAASGAALGYQMSAGNPYGAAAGAVIGGIGGYFASQ